MNAQENPLITNFSWGHMEVTLDGESLQFKDCKLWPGGARAWNWNDTGTQHEPGIQPAAVLELLDRDIDIIILSQGVFSRLKVCPETQTLLQQRGIEHHVLETKAAVALYNELVHQGRRVGGLFHSTC
jgi:hypothetical protein